MALRFLAQRPRSEAEVRRRLRRGGFGEAEVEAVLGQLRQHGLVDDEAFASYWIEQRQTFRPRGARLLRAELRQHGLGSAEALAATAHLDASAEDDAFQVASKRARQLQGLEPRVMRNRLARLLARRGFDWDTISSVVERFVGHES